MRILSQKLGAALALCLLGFSLVLTAAEPSPPDFVAGGDGATTCPQKLDVTGRAKWFPRTRRGLGITWNGIQRVHAFIEGQPRIWNHLTREANWKKWPWRFYQDWIHPLVRFLSPMWLPRANTPTFPVFKKLWRDRNYEPTADEWKIIDAHNAREKFEEKRAFMKRHRYWTTFRWVFGGTLEFARIATIVLALNFTYHQMEGGTPNVTEYVTQAQYRLKSNQVRILNDTVPFPHTSIQIGDRVYSYGQTHLSRSVVNESLRNRQIRKLVEAERIRRGDPPPPEDPVGDGSSAQTKHWSAQTGGALIKALGLGDLPQSLQAVTLNLTDEEVGNLQRYFELQVGKQYANNTMVNDCATMVVRALEDHTSIRISRLIDASPAQISFYFAFRKSLGADWVGPIYQITVEDETHPHLARNLYINILESKLFVDLVVFNQVNRLYIDVRYDREGLQHHDAVTQKVLNDFETKFTNAVNADKQVALWEEITVPGLEQKGKLGRNVENGAREVAASMNEYFDEKVAEADEFLALRTLERLDILKYEVIKKVLEKKRIELITRLTRIPVPPQG